MSEKTRNELLSAYLDGELTAVERVEVEALLASDAESQQLLEEMRALRVELQQLPSFELASDFSQRVLRQAERSILLAPAPEARRSDWDEDRKRRWTRRLLWPGLAVAAALLISVMTNIVPTSREGARVAVAPERSTETPALRALPETPARDGAAFEGGAAAVRSVDEAPGAARRLDKSMTTFDSPALQSDEIEAAELMIVEAEVDPQALRERVFEKLLAGQQIVWEEHEAREEEGESTDEAAVEYVYVEAPLEQIEGALAEMQAQPSQFVSVKVDRPRPIVGR